MDAAEELLARDGFHGASLRAITTKAGVNLAAVNYHFGSKEELAAAVIRRRLVPLNELRVERLQAVLTDAEQRGTPPRAEDILRAFIEPTLRYLKSSDEYNSFINLIGRILAEPDDTVRKIFFSLMEPVVRMMAKGLKLALPGHPEQVIFWRLHFTLGAVSHTLRCIEKCPMTEAMNGEKPINDPDSIVAMLMPFVTAGMEAPV